MITLDIETRESTVAADDIRAAGKVPGVFYGPKETATPISIDAAVFKKLWRDAGETTIISLRGVGDTKDSLIKEVTVHPITGLPEHVDFYVLEKGKKIEIAVPIEFVGTSDAEKVGGIVVKVLHEIEIEVSPADLPQHLTVDISSLQNIGDHITVSQVAIPASATYITDPEETVVSITEQKIVEDMPTTPPTEEEAAAQAAPESEEAAA